MVPEKTGQAPLERLMAQTDGGITLEEDERQRDLRNSFGVKRILTRGRCS